MTRTPLSARGAAAVALLLATSCSDSGPHGPGAPVSLALVSGDAQSSTVASPLPLPITIRVADGASRATPGILVRFAVASGGGQVAAATASTNDSGLVHATWTLGVAAGEQSLTATLSADPALATIVHATATPDAPAALELLDTLSSTAPVGAPVAAHLRVALVDRFDNASPVAGVEITASLDDGAGGPSARNELRGAVTAMTNASGLADFTQLTIVGDTGAVSLAFRAPALKSASARLRVVTGVPARLDVVGPTTVAGVVAQNGTPLRVRAVDASGNAVAGVRVAFAFVNTNLQTVTDASGIASFAQWTMPTKAGTYQLVASAPNLPSVIFGVTASAGPPAALVLLTTSELTGNAASIGPPISVRLADGFDNPVAGVSVAFAILTAGKIADVQTNASGVAQLTGWTLPSFPTTYAIVASAGRLTSAQARLTVTVGPPAKLVAFAMPTSGTVATTLPMSVQVTDLGGNAVPQREIEWSVDSGATVSPTSFFADQAGIAHASLSLGTKSGVVHVRAAVLQTGVVAEFPITARPGMLMQLSPQDTGLSLRVNTPYSVTVRALDYWRNGIPGVALTSRYSGGLAFTTLPTPAISPSTTVTDANGYATFSSLTPPQPGLEYLVIDAPTYSALFRIQGAGDHGYIAPWNGTPIDGLTWTVGAPPPRVGFIVTQANGLPAANVLVTFTLDPGNGTFVGGSAGGVLEPQLFSGLTSTATGLAAVVWNPPPVPGTYVMRVRAPAPNDGGSPLTVTIRVVP